MKTLRRLSLSTALVIGFVVAGGPTSAQDCDAMIGEIDQLLQTAGRAQVE